MNILKSVEHKAKEMLENYPADQALRIAHQCAYGVHDPQEQPKNIFWYQVHQRIKNLTVKKK